MSTDVNLVWMTVSILRALLKDMASTDYQLHRDYRLRSGVDEPVGLDGPTLTTLTQITVHYRGDGIGQPWTKDIATEVHALGVALAEAIRGIGIHGTGVLPHNVRGAKTFCAVDPATGVSVRGLQQLEMESGRVFTQFDVIGRQERVADAEHEQPRAGTVPPEQGPIAPSASAAS